MRVSKQRPNSVVEQGWRFQQSCFGNPGMPTALAGWITECEDLFATSFDGIEIEIIGPSRSGPVASCPDRDRITLTAGLLAEDFWGARGLGRRVIAHELAHVAQRRLKSVPPANIAAWDYEVEADRAALAAVSGQAFRIATADPGTEVRYWGRAGHYYTVYMVMLAAGANAQLAERIALYAQLPDLIAELDATEAGIDVMEAGAGVAAAAAEMVCTAGALARPAMQSMRRDERRNTNDAQVQIGLHALSGATCGSERRRREKILRAAQYPGFVFGLAIHPFGDSYAHTAKNQTNMYAFPLGHLADGHDPDRLDVHSDLYREYAAILYDIACAKIGGAARVMANKLNGLIDEVLAATSKLFLTSAEEDLRIKRLKAIAQRIGGATPSYEPPDNAVPWADFLRKNARLGLTATQFQSARQCAVAWTFG